MKGVFRACGILALVLFLAGPALGYIETFESSNAGWLTLDIDDSSNVGNAPAGFSGSVGNPSGSVYGLLDSDNTRLYAMLPVLTGGGLRHFGILTGQTLTVDFMIQGSVSSPSPAHVRFYIGYFDEQTSRYWVSNNIHSWNPNNDTSWSTHTVPLLESNFILWPNQDSGNMTFEEVLSGYNDIGLVFTNGNFTDVTKLGFSGQGTIYVDNFGVSAVPIPGAVWLLGSGLLGLAGLRRKLGKA